MGLELALKYHTQNNLKLAEDHYKRALKARDYKLVLFQNYGSLLKSKGDYAQSRAIYNFGLKLFPNSIEILSNRANLELVENPSTALRQYLDVFSKKILLGVDATSLHSSLNDIIQCMTHMGLLYLPYHFLIKYASLFHYNSKLMLCLLQFLYRPEFQLHCGLNSSSLDTILSKVESQIATYSALEQVELRFVFASYLSQSNNHDEAMKQYELGTSLANSCSNLVSADQLSQISKAYNIHSWNFSNSLIKNQLFSEGWTLYDYGLVTPTPNLPQRWQRALAKPFSAHEIPIWRGQPLLDKTILLLEEQGIGDAMQFISLIPKLFSLSKHVGLFISRRLYDIYSTSFADDIEKKQIAIYNASDYTSGLLKSSDFDYQIPLGSLCQYLFTSPTDYHPRVPILKTDNTLSRSLHSQYLSEFNGTKRVVGISWRGGGNASRIKLKSIEHNLFLDILKNNPDTVFVSLQYGETGSTIEKWNSFDLGIKFIYDKRFDAIKDINSWLVQVNSCDAVISVANTTIHGAGGLNIPTHCLLSKHADWRWLSNPSVQRSYWYPSVGISSQSPITNSWSDAIAKTSSWLLDGSPMPQGIDHV